MDEIREKIYDITGFYMSIETEKYFKMDMDGFNNLRSAIHIIEKIHESVRALDRATSSFGCLEGNWINRQNVGESA